MGLVEIEIEDQEAAFETAPAVTPVRRRFGRPATKGRISFEEVDERRTGSWIPVALIALVAAAFLIRLSMSEHLSSHFDEAASLMAARAVAEEGAPVFPSGTLYLQGSTLSYILAPVVLAGYGDLDDLTVLRFPSVVAGTLAVVFLFLLGRFLTGSAGGGVLAAILLALDPLSVRWSAHLRMYALLQMLVLCLLWLFFRALFGPPNRRLLQAMVAVFWFAVFTHIATLLIWPGMVLCAAIVHGRALRDRRRGLAIALGACLGAPLIMLLLNQLFQPPDKAVSQSVPGVSFVGDYFLSARQIVHPNIQAWLMLFRRTPLGPVMPTVVVAVSCLLAGRYFLTPGLGRALRSRRLIVGLLLILYWVPIALVTAFSSGAEERYLLHVHPLAFLLIVILIVDLLRWRSGPVPAAVDANGAVTYARAATADLDPRSWRPVRPAPLPDADDGDDWSDEERVAETPAVVARPLSRTVALALFGVVAVLGAGLRLFHLNHLSLWLDEGFTVLYSRLPWDSVLGFNGFYSPHPPLFFSAVKAVSLLVGDQYAARSISVVCGIATLPVFYALTSRLLDRRAALVATGVLAISPLNVYYAQEARMYALLVFLVSLTYLALVCFWQEPAWRWAILYGAAGVLAMYVDYSAVYALAPQAIPLALVAYRHGRRARPIFLAIAGAAILFVPWLPTVFDTVSSANEETRRESYLGAQADRIGTAILSIIGLSGDSSYFYGRDQAPWHRFPELRLVFLLAFISVVGLGVAALWKRWGALSVTACLFAGTLLVSIWISLISPGFAERTVLTATLGWALLIGAAFREGIGRERLLVAAGSLGAVVLASLLTLSAIYGGAQKQDWRGAAAAVERVAPLGMPLVTYSYGAVADTLIDVYEPGLLDTIRHVTVRDGSLENTLSGGVLREVGLTRNDLAAGKLGEALPAADPANSAAWYLYPPRTGEREVHAAFLAQGYERLFRRLYDHPRYKLWLDLYVRPGVRLGTPQPINGQFADNAAGWTLPGTGAALTPDDTNGTRLTLTNSATTGTAATLDVPAQGEGVYTLGTDTLTSLNANTVQVALACLSSEGIALVTSTSETPASPPPPETWGTRRTAAWCPAETATVRITLGTSGTGDVAFRNVTLDLLPIGDRDDGA
ncbi:MAG: mannosyltransferase [Thermomicrobiales bacterium]|nr:mannosyltransferase [Thermomicrobiales bacterium]